MMLSSEEVYEVLYKIPEGIIYSSILEDLDVEDIPKNRINKIFSILDDCQYYNCFDVIRAATLLCNWGVRKGFDFLNDLLEGRRLNNFLSNKILDEETYKMILYAIVGYWADMATNNRDGSELKSLIYPPIERLVNIAKLKGFNISHIYFMITDYGFFEFIPLVKDYLSYIVNDFEQYWNVHDAIELLLTIDPDFINSVLDKVNKKLSDFGIGY